MVKNSPFNSIVENNLLGKQRYSRFFAILTSSFENGKWQMAKNPLTDFRACMECASTGVSLENGLNGSNGFNGKISVKFR